MMGNLTANRLRELMIYDPAKGIFRRRITRGNSRAGSVAGGIDSNGYILIGIDGGNYKAARLAFLYVLGRWPKDQVDHINHVRDDDRWNNLREASRRENNQNISMRSNNRSGYTGVFWSKYRRKWRALIMVDEKRFHLGYYDNIDDAVLARKEAVKEYGFHTNHGRAT